MKKITALLSALIVMFSMVLDTHGKEIMETEGKSAFMLQGFYAIQSYNQFQQFYKSGTLDEFNLLHFGWANVSYREGKAVLSNTTGDFKRPKGAKDVLKKLSNSNVDGSLMIFSQDVKNFSSILKDSRLIKDIIKMSKDFKGITIDFEGIKSESDATLFVAFLKELKKQMPKNQKLTVALMSPQYTYFYDQILKNVDYGVLMLHDYHYGQKPANGVIYAPQAPLDRIEMDLKKVLKNLTPEEKKKLLLAISFGNSQYMLEGCEVVQRYAPVYNAVADRLKVEVEEGKDYDDVVFFDKESQSPTFLYVYKKSVLSQIWYENQDSVKGKIQLAKDYGLGGISLWRIGLIPDVKAKKGETDLRLNVWKEIIEMK